MAPHREMRLSRLEPEEGSRSSEVRKLREQMTALIGVVQQQAEASRRQEDVFRLLEEVSRRQAEKNERLQGQLA